MFHLFRLDPETDQAYFAGPSDAAHMAAMLLWHAIAARTGPNPGALCLDPNSAHCVGIIFAL